MKFRFIPLFLILMLTSIWQVSAQNERRPYVYMIGQAATFPPLANLLISIDSGQVNEIFTLSLNEYEVRSYEKGINLVFNHNFILKEVHFYDSGFLYKRCQDTLPANVRFDMKFKDFKNYQYTSYEVDSFNPYVYHRSSHNIDLKLYFKGDHIELVKMIGKDSFLLAQDNNLRDNWGMRVIPDGRCIEGTCFNDQGKMEWFTSLTYTGNWESGTPNKLGSLSDTTGLSYNGGFKLGFLWGKGKLNVPDQYAYDGYFIMGKKVGFGKITYSNLTRYEGHWMADKMNGPGHFWYSDQFHYEGQFRNNQFNGLGKLYSPDGYVEGSFKNGKPHGYCQQVVSRSQTSLSGTWVNGKKEGEFDLYNPISGTASIKFQNDIEVQ